MLVSLLVVFAIGFVVLQIENLFLLLNFTVKHFLLRQESEIFCGKELFAVVKHRVLRDVFTRVGTK